MTLDEALRAMNEGSTTSIGLRGNYIGTEGAKAIAAALKSNTTLTSIDLSVNRIGAEGAKAIAEALKSNTTLTSINLRVNGIDNELLQTIHARLHRNLCYVQIVDQFPRQNRLTLLASLHRAANDTAGTAWGFCAPVLAKKLMDDRIALNNVQDEKQKATQCDAWLLDSLQFLLACFLFRLRNEPVSSALSTLHDALGVFAQINTQSLEYARASFLLGEHLLNASCGLQNPSDKRAFRQSALQLFDACRRAPGLSGSGLESSDVHIYLQRLTGVELIFNSEMLPSCPDETIQAALKIPATGTIAIPTQQTTADANCVATLINNAEQHVQTNVMSWLKTLAENTLAAQNNNDDDDNDGPAFRM